MKAAVDTNGKSSFGDNDDVKAALATDRPRLRRLRCIRTPRLPRRRCWRSCRSAAATGARPDPDRRHASSRWSRPGRSRTARFENDALAFTTRQPGLGDRLRHVQPREHADRPRPRRRPIAYAEVHDVGQTLTAILAQVPGAARGEGRRSTRSTRPSRSSAAPTRVYGWWGDVGARRRARSPTARSGRASSIQPTDAAAAKRLLRRPRLARPQARRREQPGSRSGPRTTTARRSRSSTSAASPGRRRPQLPPGYKPEIAWASNADVAVIGYGSDFVAAVLDAGPGLVARRRRPLQEPRSSASAPRTSR